jgi:hypothetical protein
MTATVTFRHVRTAILTESYSNSGLDANQTFQTGLGFLLDGIEARISS